MAQLSFSRTAGTDLREILARLELTAGSAVALRYIEDFEASFDRIRDFPGSGAPRKKLGRDTRMLIVSPYLIFYDGAPKAEAVAVLRILHESRRITRNMIAAGRGS